MAFKINIRPELEAEMESLLKKSARFRSKTEYVNEAIAFFNRQNRRRLELKKVEAGFKNARVRALSQDLMDEFSHARNLRD